jgi:hypothetical protein
VPEIMLEITTMTFTYDLKPNKTKRTISWAKTTMNV